MTACDNGLDDDNDGNADATDIGCMSPTDTTERCLEGGCPACDNNVNDDTKTR